MRMIRVKCFTTIFAALTCASGSFLFAGEKDGKNSSSKIIVSESANSSNEKEFSWSKDRKLNWTDFRGVIPSDAHERTAATTACGIGFETNTISTKNNDLYIKVFNFFYADQSWARPGEIDNDVLAHEQGHFDLCELYTRKLRERMSSVKVDVHTLKPILSRIYEQLQREYVARQHAYEAETAHGINIPEQKRWQEQLEKELALNEKWSES